MENGPAGPATGGMNGLVILGLRPGDQVRWRSVGGGRWRHGIVGHRERDGSIGVTDIDGAARSIAVDRLEVGTRGARGARTWEPVARRATRSEQLSLLALLDPPAYRARGGATG